MTTTSPLAAAAARIKLHVVISSSPAILLRVVRYLSSRQIAVEVGNNFVKFPRAEQAADDAAAALKAMGFRILTSMDQLPPMPMSILVSAAPPCWQKNRPRKAMSMAPTADTIITTMSTAAMIMGMIIVMSMTTITAMIIPTVPAYANHQC